MRLLVCLIAVLSTAAVLAQRPGGPPNVLVAVIDQRDYQGNVQTTESSLFPTPHPGLEFSAHRGTPQQPDTRQNVSHVAYVKGATSTISLRLTNQQNTTATGTLTFTGAQLVVPGPNNAPAPQELPVSLTCSSPTFTLPPFGSTTMTATLSGLPSHVAVGQLQVKFELPVSYGPPGNPGSSNNGTAGGWVDWERICILDAAPIGLQAVPWTDFLEYTCRWAYGASGTTAVLREMTKGIFLGRRSPPTCRLEYFALDANYWPVNSGTGSDSEVFFLGQLLSDLGLPYGGAYPTESAFGDCRDFAGLLHLAALSQGVSTQCVLYRPQNSAQFKYWPLCPAGQNPAVDSPIHSAQSKGNYTADAFQFHVVVSRSEQIYDASSAYLFSTTGGSWLQVAYEWPIASYWQRTSHPHFGLAHHATTLFSFHDSPLGINSQQVQRISLQGFNPTQLQ